MKRLGFTLIELLAVIIILVAIMAITIPIITNSLEQAEKGALADEARTIIRTIENYPDSTLTGTIDIVNGSSDISVKMSSDINGYVVVSEEGEVEELVIYNNNYEASLQNNEIKVKNR